jgi:hypothetical protein
MAEENDDGMDAIEYAIYTYKKKSGGKWSTQYVFI